MMNSTFTPEQLDRLVDSVFAIAYTQALVDVVRGAPLTVAAQGYVINMRPPRDMTFDRVIEAPVAMPTDLPVPVDADTAYLAAVQLEKTHGA